MMRALGGLGEWFKPAVLKTAEGKPSVSSNLTASARMLFNPVNTGFVPPVYPQDAGGFCLYRRMQAAKNMLRGAGL